ncbi:hypothetical protein TIFTF001_043027 [Ficus carica]|uniref:Non-haem dioxygenase N-terminal domain-containing protein n=1 Tax=Ficus carica TaxID=3494 RepID=A0AA88CWC0_FICCA|nr:hypothetical protein TIFTF001_043024 [Ficus carica]GMN20199.1 hypothetical protein TIFTF001_043027 [Ficus carica]
MKSFEPELKGLVDYGVTEIPCIFHHPSDNLEENFISVDSQLSVPVVDLRGLTTESSAKRKEIVERVREASEKWGFFQIVNHGIPKSVLEEMKYDVRWFYEQATEVKKESYARDPTKTVMYNSNFDLYSGISTNWSDIIICHMAPNPPNAEDDVYVI